MAIIDLRNSLNIYKFEHGLLQKNPCSKQDNKTYQRMLKNGEELPVGVYARVYEDGTVSSSEFYTVYQSDLTEKEIDEYLKFKELSYLKSIKNYILFFVVLTVIGIVLAMFGMMSMM